MAHEALDDAGVSPDELGLVIVGNAMAGRLSDQGCVRGQSWLRKAGLNEAAIINVDNSCAGGSSALHLATMAAAVQDRPVLALGVEKMWTGNRGETIAGIEDGLPSEYRHDLHDRRHESDNPAGSILMGLNNALGAASDERGRRYGSPDRLGRRESLRPRVTQPTGPVPALRHRGRGARLAPGRRRADPADVQLVHRWRRRGRPGRPGVPAPASAPRIIGSVARSGNGLLDYHDRLTQVADAAWEVFGFGPDDTDLVELHDATAAEELYALESLGFFAPG